MQFLYPLIYEISSYEIYLYKNYLRLSKNCYNMLYIKIFRNS